MSSLCYRVDLKDNDPIWSDNMTIRVNGSGHILHTYVNGEYIGRLSVHVHNKLVND